MQLEEELSKALALKAVLLRFWHVLKNRVFLCVALGYAAYTFVIGGLSFFGPTYVVQALRIRQSVGNLREYHNFLLKYILNFKKVFGAVTGVTGLLGTFLGGIVLDKFKKSDDDKVSEL